ncbi:methyltransferase domain-containing protein [Variovorax boronicumulans]|uniref:methyltransferase domain-containing protein n=1 Tax=Variovorax boronicumulans TaxID=436515 RepID=UPI0009ED0FD9|nr:methyltransferase domain-containing protein [Variovorax boronicumulans]
MKKRIHVLAECGADGKPFGASHIRLLLPLSHPSIQEKFTLSYGVELPGFSVDLVVVERGWRHDADFSDQARLLKHLEVLGIPYIYATDDNLLDLNSQPGAPDYPSARQRQIMIRFAREAAGVLVSTDALKCRMARLNANIQVVGNYLDERLFEFDALRNRLESRRASDDSSLVIGYMGTYSHLEDLLMIAEPLRRFLHARKDSVRMEIVGIGDEALVRGVFNELPVRVLKVPVDQVEYPKFMQWMQREVKWDFAIAPLIESGFNDCKSDLKFLDYSANNIPGIYSSTRSYVDTVVNKKNGLLASASPDEWRGALELLADDSALRLSLADEAFSYVRKHRMLETNAARWGEAIDAILIAKTAEKNLTNVWSGQEVSFSIPATRNEKILALVDVKDFGLEIGPSFSPVAPKSQGFNIQTLDHASRRDLIRKYEGVDGVDVSKIEEVDFVWKGEVLPELIGGEGKYDYVIASHVVEHTPDLVSFLQQCEAILKDGGVLSLVIPDKRYCFDYFRGISTTGDVLQAHVERRRVHTVGTVLDHFAYQVFLDGKPSWGKDKTGELAFSVAFDEALRMAEAAKKQDEYLDVHNWRFTPSSFRLIVDDLVRMGLINLHVEREYPTFGCEFFVSFVKRDAAAALKDRFVMASRTAAELRAQ